jgi:ParB family chromosome partitioning protein
MADLTRAQKDALLEIQQAAHDGRHLKAKDVNGRIRNALLEAELVRFGSGEVGWRIASDAMVLTIEGRKVADTIRRLRGEPSIDDIRHAAEQGSVKHVTEDGQAVILGIDSPTQDQIAHAEEEREGKPWIKPIEDHANGRTYDEMPDPLGGKGNGEHGGNGITRAQCAEVGLTDAAYSYMARLLLQGKTDDEIRQALADAKTVITDEQLAFLHSRDQRTPRKPVQQENTTMTTATLIEIPITALHARPENLRTNANGDDLVASIKADGIIQPLNVSKNGDGYLINAGHRRLDGAAKAGLMFVPCLVSDTIETETDFTFAMLIENMQRADLTPVEQARGFRRLVDLGVKQKEIADHVGISATVVSRRLKLLELPDEVLDRVAAGDVSLELAEAYTKLDAKVLPIALKKEWPIRRIEESIGKDEAAKTRAKMAKVAADLGIRVLPEETDDGRHLAWSHGAMQIKGEWVDIGPVDVEADDRAHDEYYLIGQVDQLKEAAARQGVFGVLIQDVDVPGVSWHDRPLAWVVFEGGPVGAAQAKELQSRADERAERNNKDAESQARRQEREKAEAAKLREVWQHNAAFLRSVADADVDAKDVALWSMQEVARDYSSREYVAEALGWIKPGGRISDTDWNKKVKALDAKGLVRLCALTVIANGFDHQYDHRAGGRGLTTPRKDHPGAAAAKKLGWQPYKAPRKVAARKTKAE